MGVGASPLTLARCVKIGEASEGMTPVSWVSESSVFRYDTDVAVLKIAL